MNTTTLAAVASLAFAALTSAAVPLAAQKSAAPKLDDPTIVAIFDAANGADIETGALARERGSSKEVREFGAMLARDHAAVQKLGRDLAARLHVTPTPPKDDPGARAHAAAMTRLRALHGADFDRAFLRHEVTFHQSVIDAVTSTLLPAIRNAELRKLVEQVAPAFEAHKQTALNLENRLAAATGGR
jgi:putative membrane protein